MSENDGKIHTVYMRDPLKIKSQNLPYKKTDLYGRISRGFPGPCRDLVLVANSLRHPLSVGPSLVWSASSPAERGHAPGGRAFFGDIRVIA